MLLNWLNAQEAVQSGTALADSFPDKNVDGKELQRFVQRASHEIHSQNLNFYKRAKFANAFKWRLLEKGVEAEVAADVTQKLLVLSFNEAPPSSSSGAPAPTPASASQAPETLIRQAQDALSRGDYETAVQRFAAVVTQRPRDAEARSNLGACLSKLGRYAQAEDQFRKAIKRQPDCITAHTNLASLQITRGLFAEAETVLRRALSVKPSNLEARGQLGLALFYQGRLLQAREELNKVLRAAPRDAEALHGLGQIALTEGRFEEAEDLFKQALTANPALATAWSSLTAVRRMRRSDKAWLKRAEEVADSLSSPVEQASVRFAIGKYLDDVGDYAKAFKSYARANDLLKTIAAPYQPQVRTEFVDDMKRVYTPGILQGASSSASTSNKPILIVGMMRSGTSLVEQILASHPDVGGAGELDFWTNAVRRHETQARQTPLDEKVRKQLADAYLRTLAHHCPDSRRVVDKAPTNADYLGVIHTVFPHARIIHMQRDPRDTCLSCYFQSFSAGVNFSLDLDALAHYYGEHARLMAHWRRVLPPGTILDVPYEELVADQKHWTRKILDFLELEWDERCMEFHRTQRAVSTASRWQVRQPMYRNAVQRWQNYSEHIGPLRHLPRA